MLFLGEPRVSTETLETQVRRGTGRPACSVIPVPELHHGHLVEIDAIAALRRRP